MIIMSDVVVEGENNGPPRPQDQRTEDIHMPLTPSQPDPTSIMDLDFADLCATWQFDPIPPSLFLPHISDQPFSPPVWAPADFSDNKSAVAATAATAISAAFSGGCCVSSDCRVMPCNPETGGEAQKEDNEDDDGNDYQKKLPPSFLGSTRLDISDVSSIIKERMTQALRYFKDSTDQNQILAQVWAPIKRGHRYMLTTLGQPFVLSRHSNGLHQYRTVSLMYMFSADGLGNGTLGLPGRVFRQKLPEWTPDVQFYSSKEYPRVNHAKDYNVRGTLALPVFEPVGLSCVGVLELIMTSQKISYALEVEKVCQALETVNLKSSEILDQPDIQICNIGCQNALAEMLQVVTEVCETYKLPLVQTWIPCRRRSILAYGAGVKKSCSSFDGSCMNQICMSTSDVAFYVVDARMCYFREACSEHHLQKGQGVAGRTFLSKGSCFCGDIRRFSKMEYPLVHYAKLFGLASSFAICLRSKHTGEDDYILEFFLPLSLIDRAEQFKLLDSILATTKQHFHSLVVASGRSIEEERQCMEVVDGSINDDLDFLNIEPLLISHPDRSLPMMEELNGVLMASKDDSDGQKLAEEKEEGVQVKKSIVGNGGTSNVASSLRVKEVKKGERKRGKAEKQISLEVLQQYFAGSLKDAAKSLGVCPTTMKRICRQHGISRWPSRKINKVNRSLSKLKCVIESVPGADVSFGLSPTPPNSLPAGVGSTSWPSGLNESSQQQQQQQSLPYGKPSTLPGGKIDPSTSTTQRSYCAQGERANGDEPNNKLNGSSRGFHGSPRTTATGSNESSSGRTSTSHGSCQGSPGTVVGNNNGMGLMVKPNGNLNSLVGPFHLQDSLLMDPQPESIGGMLLVKEAGSSNDLRNLCPSMADANVEEGIQEPGWLNPLPNKIAPCPENGASTTCQFSARQEMRTVTIKATFREDIIRFRFTLNSGIVDLREEVAKRLKLELGTFEIKYLDDDNEWVLIACDADLRECLDLITSSGSNVIRLSIHHILGGFCESWGE